MITKILHALIAVLFVFPAAGLHAQETPATRTITAGKGLQAYRETDGRAFISILVGEYPPYVYEDTDGNWTGIEMDIARAVAGRADITLVPVIQTNWRRNLYHAERGLVGLIPSLPDTRNSHAHYHLLFRTVSLGTVLMMDKDAPPFSPASLADLTAGNRIWGYQEGVFYGPELNAALAGDLLFAGHFEPVAGFGLNRKKLRGGRIHGYLDIGGRCGIPEHTKRIPLPFVSNADWYLAASDAVPEHLRQRMRTAAQQLEQEGELERIRKTDYCKRMRSAAAAQDIP
ncbi:transporter substrate-binding domain-containing protein [Oleidesulfovibrio alaskensis]|uniref:transporter substrate-binding domain-containing protein n=1 Tax=Oleidesulfovibrio alaskensis TaxID=58180 RepID=UPI002354F3DE|nr:transporter substrate-binding domain-containing protein [Oleidesulfovibrio alaskensis]